MRRKGSSLANVEHRPVSTETHKPEQSTPEQIDDLTLDKETLKDLEPRSEEQDKVRGGFGTVATSSGCNVKGMTFACTLTGTVSAACAEG
jgi:hypothetical protein